MRRPTFELFIMHDKSSGCCGAHSLAEVYSPLTRMPGKRRIIGVQPILFVADIRNEAEYQHASARLLEERNRLSEHRARLRETGLADDEIKRLIDPIESFHLQL